MRRIYLLFLLFVGGITGARAQSFTGYDVSSYTGVYGTLFNPANILDHRFKADINLIGFSAAVQNNVLLIDPNDKENGVKVPNPITHEGRGGSLSDILGPGFMFRINDRNAFSVTTRFRTQVNINRIDKNLLNILLQDDPTVFSQSKINLKNGAIQAHAWNELAFTYATQIGVSDYGVWKAAVSVKVLGGQGAAYLTTRNLSFTYDDSLKADQVQRVKYGGAVDATGNINFNYSDFIDGFEDKYNYQFFRQPGIGADIGVTYEYRDVMQVYETGYNEETNDYKWKAGASISDIGSIRYRSSSNSYNTHLTGQQYLFNDLQVPADSSSIKSIANWYKQKLPGTSSDARFTMNLPTTLHLIFDYAFNEWLSAAAHVSLPIITSQPDYYIGTHSLSQINITPRAELRWCGFYLPVTYQFAGGFQTGMAFRIGPLTIGSASLINIGILQKSKSADGYIILRIPFFKDHHKTEETPQSNRLSKHQRKIFDCPQ